MAGICMGFEVHQPFRLNPVFSPEEAKGRRDLKSFYFDRRNRDILRKVARNCYIPAAEIVLDALDGGMRYAFSFSGTLIEQMEEWCPEALSLFTDIAVHPNTELLAQTYYHSLAGFFADRDEFVEEVRMHTDLMHDLFGVRPRVAENTEFSLDDGIAADLRDLGFQAVYTEGADRIVPVNALNETCTCCGIPLLLRNCPLSDDIAFRFSWPGWDKRPLMADTYASWIAMSPGRCAHVFIDFETFGEHQPRESGIFEFLAYLPAALADEGVALFTPSEAAALPPAAEITLRRPVSWADLEKDESAWLGNRLQRYAFSALEHSPARQMRPELWRYLGTSDHFYYLAQKGGSCGDVHRYFCPAGIEEAYDTFMAILSHLERRCLGKGKRPLASVPNPEAFHFRMPDGRYAGVSAHGLREFEEALLSVPGESVLWHLERGDYAPWIRDAIGDRKLAAEVETAASPADLERAVHERRCSLCTL
ncbi:glycoside hydrolase family 57 protein [Methanofollis fontis]|uniref:Alpha-amlyase n=1 Tax=Methanofollis fontis TaxID=2052832 RepID=A0A483CRJ7_9EURY|nr:glycoside hydrolase family 57 protein [Methanofollis fontis]TAJ45745.1 alpha-amlyase [Methanofollis fontis]